MHKTLTNTFESPISSQIRIHPRFLRSIYLEHDILDPESSLGYVLTPIAQDALRRVMSSFSQNSTQRAWRVSGDYGSGKTAWGLALTRIAQGKKTELPSDLQRFVGHKKILPVVATGNNEPLGCTILRAFGCDLPMGEKVPPSLEAVLEAVRAGLAKARKNRFSGLLLLLDELGKNLEFAAQHPDLDDVFLLQRLAEEAARSGSEPFVIVAMLHQGVAAYTVGLDSTAKREWNKVAGRFEEIVFTQPLEQVSALVAATLNVDLNVVSEQIQKKSETDMSAAIKSGLYGAAAAQSLISLGRKIYPLHPTVLPALVRTMRRFGQNERSLFSFISSAEPMGLQYHSFRPFSEAGYYRIHHLFDYVHNTLLPNITTGTSHTHWGVIESILASTPIETPEEEAVLKTIAMLTLLDASDLPATEEIVSLAVGGRGCKSAAKAIIALRNRGVIYERGTIKGYCLWPHSSVNLDELFVKAVETTTQTDDGIALLCQQIHSECLVPRAYYVKTGTLRYAEVNFVPAAELPGLISQQPQLNGKGADINIRVILPADKIQEHKAKRYLEKNYTKITQGLIIAVADPPGSAIAALKDLVAWQWVKKNTPQLAGDRYAKEEVARQISQSEKIFRGRLGGLDNLAIPGKSRMDWFYSGGSAQLTSGRELLAFIGKECALIYSETPHILNELINRRFPSSAAVAARSKLVEAMATESDKAMLGMDDAKRPAEMALYLSILRAGGFHAESDVGWVFRVPKPEHDKCRLVPALGCITKTLTDYGSDALVPVPKIFEALSMPPFGIREGLQPIILAIYLATNHQRVALYEDGTYLDSVGGDEFLRIMKEPQFFNLQYCAIEGIRYDVFYKLLELMKIKPRDINQADLIDLVRPLVVFISKEVPEYCRKTNNMTEMAVAARRALLTTREPLKLIFTALPVACGLPPVDPNSFLSPDQLASRLRTALQEIRTAYPKLIERISNALFAAFDIKPELTDGRSILTARASRLAVRITEPTLKAFTLRLSDISLEDRSWVESIANFLSKKSPERWSDNDETEFHHQLQVVSERFKRTELSLTKTNDLNGHSCRIFLTKSDGFEVGDLVNWHELSENTIQSVDDEFQKIISRYGRNGLAAAMHALWKYLDVGTRR